MSREYNYGGTSLIVDSIEEIFESGAVSTKTVNNIKQIIGQQRQSKDINKLKEQIGGAAEDGTISASEKPGLKREWASLESSYATISYKFEQDENLSDNTFFYLLKANYEKLSPIMGEILADMNSDYANKEKVAKITDLFVSCWDYIAKCTKFIEDKMSLSDRFSIQVSAEREIVSTLSLSLKLLFYSNGSYVDVTYNDAYDNTDFVWRKTSDESFLRTGRTLNLSLSDFSSNEETFSVTFKHVSYYEDANNTEFVVEKSINFSVYTGTLSQWAWSDAETKEELLADPFKVWTTDRTESNGKKYLWRRDTKDLLKIDSEKEWTYFRESGLDGLIGKDGYSRAQLTLYKRSANGEPTKDDLGTITYTFATNAYAGELGGWSKTIPTGTGDIYAIYASALFAGETDTISPNEWTTPAKLSTEGAKGESGMSVYTIILFKRSSDIPSTPSGNVTYNFHNNVLSGAEGWQREIPTSDGNPLYAITATAASRDETDIIYPSEWSAPSIYVVDGKDGEDGLDGVGIKSAIIDYQVSTSATEVPTGAWLDDIPEVPNGSYLWTRTSITYTNDTSSTSYSISYFSKDGEPAEYLKVSCWPQFYTLNGRGVNDNEQAINVTIDRTFIPIENPCYIQVSFWKNEESVDSTGWQPHNASSTYRIEIPLNITYDKIIVEVSCGTWNKAISIDAVIDEYKKGEKQLGVVYLHNNKLYKDADHTQEITHLNDNLAKPFIDGDYALVMIGEDLIPYRFTDGFWTALSSDITNGQDYANIMLDTLVDVFNKGKDVKASMSAHYAFISQLAAQTATIERIFSKHLKVLEGGSIYGGAYKEDGSKTGEKPGFYLSSEGRLLTQRAELVDVTITGELEGKYFNTIAKSEVTTSVNIIQPTATYYSKAKARQILRDFTKSELQWTNEYSLSKITGISVSGPFGYYSDSRVRNLQTLALGTRSYTYFDGVAPTTLYLAESEGEFTGYESERCCLTGVGYTNEPINLISQSIRLNSQLVVENSPTYGQTILNSSDLLEYAIADQSFFNHFSSLTNGETYVTTGSAVIDGVAFDGTFKINYKTDSITFIKDEASIAIDLNSCHKFDSNLNLTIYINLSGIQANNIYPASADTGSIGLKQKRFKEIYVTNIYADGDITTDKNIIANKVWGAVYN